MLTLALSLAEQGISHGSSLELVTIFVLVVGASLYADLWLHRGCEEVSVVSAARSSLGWVGLSLLFAGYLRWRFGAGPSSLFLSGWVLEKALSVDNLLVFVAIFKYFKLSTGQQRRVLYYGILGAVVLRLVFVMAAGFLRHAGPWVDFIFAAVVLASAVKMLRSGGDETDGEDFSRHRVVMLAQRVFAVIPRLDGQRFFVSQERARTLLGADFALLRPAARYATPAFVCMLVVEASDVMFAFDSVPAVVAVTRDPVLIYSAMLFAVLGLRSLYFLLNALTKWLVHLEKAVIALLFFVGAKLALHAANEMFHWPGYEPSPGASVAIIVGVLFMGVVASLLWPPRDDEASPPPSR